MAFKNKKRNLTKTRPASVLEEFPTVSSDPNKIPTDKQRAYIKAMATPGMTSAAAMRLAGYTKDDSNNRKALNAPHVQALIAKEREEYAKASAMTRRRVVDGFLRAVDIADATSDSIAMTAGWREIGRMCGFYAPQVVQHKVSFDAATMKERLQAMSEEDLLRLTDESGNLEEAPAILDGDFELISDSSAASTSESSLAPENLENDLRNLK